jgi:hypothetical protein
MVYREVNMIEIKEILLFISTETVGGFRLTETKKLYPGNLVNAASVAEAPAYGSLL